MPHSIHGKDITEAVRNATFYHLFAKEDEIEFRGPSHSHLFDMVITADSCDYDLDVGKATWFTESRWNRLVREYLNPDSLEIFLKRADSIINGKGISVGMLFNNQESFEKKHKWGGCLMGLVFRRGSIKGEFELILNSRTCFVGYMAWIDVGLVYHIAKKILNPESIKFRWNVLDHQVSYPRILSYIFFDKELLKAFNKQKENDMTYPTMRYVKAVFRRNFTVPHDLYWENGNYELSKYGPVKRLQKRWLSLQGHTDFKEAKSLNIRDLSL